MVPVDEVLIIGASARAAAFSAARAGLRPRCMDLFADADLAGRWPVVRFDPDRDADDLERLAGSFDCPHWFYTGSMEGGPDLVERLNRIGRLLGNGPDVLRRVRDPWQVSAALTAAGLPTPTLRTSTEAKALSGRWLRKSRSTAGGMGVSWADATSHALGPDEYLQEFVPGEVCSALFVAAAGQARLIGTALQLPGAECSPFLYRGNIAPWPVGAALADVRRLGEVMAADFGLVGLFGLDFILNDDTPWTVEVNPRYTASVELFEAAFGRPLLSDHVRACLEGEISSNRRQEIADAAAFGKCIIYAPRRLTFGGLSETRSEIPGHGLPLLADIPHEGTTIEAGEPVLTVFSSGDSPAACRENLERQADWWRERLERG